MSDAGVITVGLATSVGKMTFGFTTVVKVMTVGLTTVVEAMTVRLKSAVEVMTVGLTTVVGVMTVKIATAVTVMPVGFMTALKIMTIGLTRAVGVMTFGLTTAVEEMTLRLITAVGLTNSCLIYIFLVSTNAQLNRILLYSFNIYFEAKISEKTQAKHKTELTSFETQHNDVPLNNESMCFNYDDLEKKTLVMNYRYSLFCFSCLTQIKKSEMN